MRSQPLPVAQRLTASRRRSATVWRHSRGRSATDRRRARIQQIEVVGVSEELEEQRRDARSNFAEMISQRCLAAGASTPKQAGLDLRVLALGLVGSVNETLVDYLSGRIDVDLDSLVDHQVAMFMGVTTMLLRDLRRVLEGSPSNQRATLGQAESRFKCGAVREKVSWA